MSLVLHAFIISAALSRVTYRIGITFKHTLASVTHEIVKINIEKKDRAYLCALCDFFGTC